MQGKDFPLKVTFEEEHLCLLEMTDLLNTEVSRLVLVVWKTCCSVVVFRKKDWQELS